MSLPIEKVPLDRLIVSAVGKRGWLEWDGKNFFLADKPSGLDAPPLPPVIPPDILEPDPDDPKPPPGGGGADPTGEYLFFTPGEYTFTVPSGITRLEVVVVAAGGGGASGAMYNCCAGGGGQAGEVRWEQIAVNAGDTFRVVVGRAGSGACGRSVSGNQGQDSQFGAFVSRGGLPGSGGRQVSVSSRWQPSSAGVGNYLHEYAIGGGNEPGGAAQKTSQSDYLGHFYDSGSKPHKVGGRGGSNGIGIGGNGGAFSWAGPAGEVSGGQVGGFPGGGGGGGGTDEGSAPGCGAAGASGAVYVFWGKGRLARFPQGVPIFNARDRAGTNTEVEFWWVQKRSSISSSDRGDRGCCVHPDTPVTMADGTTRPIKDIRCGDFLRVWDTESHSYTSDHVAGLVKSPRRFYYTLHFDDSTILRISDDHPMLKEGDVWEAFDPEHAEHIYGYYKLNIQRFDKQRRFLNADKTLIGVEKTEEALTLHSLSMQKSTCHSYIASGIIVHNKWGDNGGGW